MPRYAFVIEYDGAPFAGWQRQKGALGVQEVLEAALARLDPAAPRTHAAGRTDAGVHATHQVAHADLARRWEPFRLAEALNAHLRPHPVAVLACAEVDEGFHARFSATERRYRYRILCRRAPPALDRGRVWHVRWPLDAAAMREAAAVLVGRHDFTTFRASICQARSPVKTLDEIRIEEAPVPGGREIRLFFRARSFLHNQVRSMVGSLERVGAGRWSAADLRAALEARDRAACGPVAPPEGLTLIGVSYPDDPFAPGAGG
ncbi:MAG: tRNA pseudouridine(38-40) synthase TruA [Alphaproteobacteria bacterium]|nr:MAG: tRNA pseudouridine(38-40) synthase TruA [Alphaproteobacteria bacterium]